MSMCNRIFSGDDRYLINVAHEKMVKMRLLIALGAKDHPKIN